jgi:carbon monoxide dehydrogenase subunit G
MELTNEFTVAVDPATAWSVLTDVERIAPCMPGAQLQEIEGDEYRGIVKVKVGPITAQYKGKASFLERDEVAHRAVLRAEGRETRGQGNAAATITLALAPDGDGTRATIVTDLTISGKVAQFGRGVMADISGNLLDQFVECLESSVLSSGGPSTAPEEPVDAVPPAEPSERVEPAVTPPARRIDMAAAEPVNLLDAAGAPVLKRVGPILALVAIGWLLRVLIRRSRR